MKLQIQKKAIILYCFFFLLIFAGYFFYTVYVHYYHSSRYHAPYQADLSDLYDDTLSHYYVHTDGTEAIALESGMYASPPFNQDGVPIVDYQGDIGRQINPVTIAQYGLDNWELYLQTQDEKYVDILLLQADWLVEHQEAGEWLYDFDVKERSLQKGWISAMAQGKAISLLLRVWQFTYDSIYFQSARKAFGIFQLTLDQNGVSFFESDSSIWFEEYPNSLEPTHVLNGHIWAL
ncbi:D-glucuronyl C5-epimerase family protein, partial [bacterium]|nr:D-glucuronyl C5-epimerase family protein [bacterium]